MNEKLHTVVRRWIGHDMIQKYTEVPAYPDARTTLTHTFVTHFCEENEQAPLCVVASSLAQLGMDMHDMIDPHDVKVSETLMRSRQLKVLSGDYFSSRFYQLLAQQHKLEFIRQVSESICTTNRLKMVLYRLMTTASITTQQYWEHHVAIKVGVYQSFTSLFNEPVKALWEQCLTIVANCEFIVEQLQSIEQPNDAVLTWATFYAQEATEQPVNQQIVTTDLVNRLQSYVATFRTIVQQQQSESLRHELLNLISNYERLIASTN